MLFSSDRAGYRSHGSWGAESDAYLMFFDLEAYERFRMNKEERALAKENMTNKEKKQEEKKEEKEKKNLEKPKAQETEDLKFDLETCRDRIVRRTAASRRLRHQAEPSRISTSKLSSTISPTRSAPICSTTFGDR